MRKGRTWRVQITQSNGSVRYFGRFSSETRARAWIAAHVCLTNRSPAVTADYDGNDAQPKSPYA
jgi:hypothetical protein